MAGPIYPDVPATDGVPDVARDASNSDSSTTAPATKDGASVKGGDSNSWGVYTSDGALALDPDNIAAVTFHAESTLADFPIEEGGFESYDKVTRPYASSIRMTKGGTVAERKAFLSACRTIKDDTELYSIVTPEATFTKANMMGLSVDRSQESGAGLIIAEMQFQEIRQNVKVAYSSTADPASADAQDNGPTQTESIEDQAGLSDGTGLQ